MEKSRVYGGLCMDALAVYDHRLSCWKTCQLSLFEEESTWSERLPNWGMIANGVLFQLGDPRVSERHTFGNGGSSLATLPTPRAGHHHIENEELRKKRKEKHGNVPQSLGNSIVEQIRMGMLPTPTASQLHKPLRPLCPTERAGKHGIALVAALGEMLLPTPTGDQRVKRYKQGGRSTLCAIMEMLPTPTANEHKYRLKGNSQQSKCLGAMTRRGELTNGEITGKDFQLNPRFVEEMMGFPIGWTDLEL